MLLKLVGVVLGCSESETWRNDTLDRRVVSKVEEERYTVETAVLLEVLLEESCGLHVDTHGREHDGEVIFMSVMNILCWALDQTCLSDDLGSNLVAC